MKIKPINGIFKKKNYKKIRKLKKNPNKHKNPI